MRHQAPGTRPQPGNRLALAPLGRDSRVFHVSGRLGEQCGVLFRTPGELSEARPARIVSPPKGEYPGRGRGVRSGRIGSAALFTCLSCSPRVQGEPTSHKEPGRGLAR